MTDADRTTRPARLRARLGAALSLWSVRGLIGLFLLGSAVGLLYLQEGWRLHEEVALLDSSRLEQRRLDEVGEALQALRHRLAAEVQPGGANPYELETRSLRDRLERLAAATAAGAPAPVGPLLEAVEQVAAAGESAAEAGQFSQTLSTRWEHLRTTVREAAARSFGEQLWRIRERARQRRLLLLFFGGAAATAVMFLIWGAGEGVLQTRARVAALVAGAPLPPLAERHRGELGELCAQLDDIAANWHAAAAGRLAAEQRRERYLQRLAGALAGYADGDFARPVPAAEDQAGEGIGVSLGRIVEAMRLQEERVAAERTRLQGCVVLPREELFQLKQFFELAPEKQAAAAQLLGEQSPLRDIATRIAEMVSRQRLLDAQVRESAAKILEHSGNLFAAVREREAEFRRESRLIHETSTTVNEVSVAAKQTAQMVEFVFRSSQEAMQAAEEGQDMVRRSIEGISVIAQRVNQIAEQILQLSGKSQEVGTIVRAIGDLSKQTNLLALNAAIEAAGAGEHGKGFAVVAKEIRELAIRSSRSTQDIQQLIKEIQTATNSAVLATEEGSKSVQTGVRLVHSLNQAFGQVLEKFHEVVESAQQISTAAQEQTAGARQVAHSIESIDQMVRTTVEDLQGLLQILEDHQGVTRGFAELVGEGGGGEQGA